MIIQEMGGCITCKSTHGEGSCFSFLVLLNDLSQIQPENGRDEPCYKSASAYRCRNPMMNCHYEPIVLPKWLQLQTNVQRQSSRPILRERSFAKQLPSIVEESDQSQLVLDDVLLTM